LSSSVVEWPIESITIGGTAMLRADHTSECFQGQRVTGMKQEVEEYEHDAHVK